MKNLKTPFLRIVAVLYLAFPLVFAVYELTLLDVSYKQVTHGFFTWSYWFFSIVGMITGYAFHEMKRWSWNLFLFMSFLVAYADALILSRYSASENKIIVYIVSLVLQGLLLYRVGKDVRVPYFLPRIRWWESNPRYKTTIAVSFTREGETLTGEIMDLSGGGCFIKCRSDLNQNERLTVRFGIFGETLDIVGEVVWRSKSSVTHPKGVGVKFDALSALQKKILRMGLAQLRKLNQVQAARGKMSPEEYSRKLHQIRSTSLGITAKEKNRAS